MVKKKKERSNDFDLFSVTMKIVSDSGKKALIGYLQDSLNYREGAILSVEIEKAPPEDLQKYDGLMYNGVFFAKDSDSHMVSFFEENVNGVSGVYAPVGNVEDLNGIIVAFANGTYYNLTKRSGTGPAPFISRDITEEVKVFGSSVVHSGTAPVAPPADHLIGFTTQPVPNEERD